MLSGVRNREVYAPIASREAAIAVYRGNTAMTDDELDTLSTLRDRLALLAELATAVISIRGATLHGMAQLLNDTVSELNGIMYAKTEKG
jgi:hypothetical protein